MSPGGAIEGVVLGDDGRPLAGARVMAMSGFTAEPGQQVTTDELGHYRLEHLEPGTVRVLVMKMDVSDGPPDMSSLMQGMKMETAEVEDGKTTMLNFPTSEGSIHVTGRLLHADERPLKAVMMWFPDEGGRMGGGSLASSVSGDDGTFSVRLPEPGLYRVVAQSLAADPRQRESFMLEAAVEDRPEVQVELMIPDTSVSGMVTDVATGAPLEGVQVRARPRDGQRPAGGTTTTLASGRYRLEGLTPGEYDLLFRQRGYGMAVLEELDLDQGDALSDRDVTLAEAVPVPLDVVDDRGRPIGGAWAMTAVRGSIGGQELGLVGEDGRMTIDVLPPGDHEICVWAPGYAPHVTTVTVPPLDGGAFRAELSPGAPVEIRVAGASGEPLEDVAVEVRTEDGADLTRMLRLALGSRGGRATTGADGMVEIPGLEPGDYLITASLGELEATEKVTVSAGEDNEWEIDLR
jgi:protocatechuate 3,4-dioxygenase beta subunit